MKVIKRIRLQTVLSVLLLTGFFFLDWIVIDEPAASVSLSAWSLPMSLESFDFLKHIAPLYGAPMTDLSFLKVSYLLYFVALFGLVHIVADLTGRKGWYLRVDYIAGLLAVLITGWVMKQIVVNPSDYCGAGYKLVRAVSIVGLVVQLIEAAVSSGRRKKAEGGDAGK